MHNLALDSADPEERLRLFTMLLAAQRQKWPEGHSEEARTMMTMAPILFATGEYERALSLAHAATELYVATLGPHNQETREWGFLGLAQMLVSIGRFTEAERALDGAALPAGEAPQPRRFGPPEFAVRGELLRRQGHGCEALELAQRAWSAQVARVDHDPDIDRVLVIELGLGLSACGRPLEALSLLRDAAKSQTSRRATAWSIGNS